MKRTIAATLLLAAAFIFGIGMLLPLVAHGQTLSVVYKGDSVLAIAKYSCTSACADSNRIVWQYGGQRFPRTIPPKTIDTLRIAALSVNDSVFIETDPYKSTRKAAFVRGYVHPAPPVVTPPVTPPATIPTNVGYVLPMAPATFSTAYPTLTRSGTVPIGADLQAALNAAQPGDELLLARGSSFTGNYSLPAKSGAGWIVVRCANAIPAGTRTDTIAPCAKITTPNASPAIVAAGTARWRFVGVEINHVPPPANPNQQNYGIVVLGAGNERSLALQPADIVLDRVWIHGAVNSQTSRCLAFNGTRLAVIDSWLSDCHGKGFDSQGINGYGGPGPFLIHNNHIEGSGQNVMFGGADPAIANVSPSDIIITRNHLFKPLSWGNGKWTVKAAFELKHARRVLFEGNVIENHWADGQGGGSILFQTLSDNNTAWAWTTINDVTVRNNRIINATSGMTMVASVMYNCAPPCQRPTTPTSRVLVENNWFDQVGRDPFRGAAGVGIELFRDLVDVTVLNNTWQGGPMQKVINLDGPAQVRTRVEGNVFPNSSYQVTGNGAALASFGILFRNNVIPGLSANALSAGALGNASGADTLRIKAATAGVVR